MKMYSTWKHYIYESYHTPRRFIYNLFDEPAIVLLYHRVYESELDSQKLCISPDNFYQQIEYLKKNHNLLATEEFYSVLHQKKRFPSRTVLLTFDDGYADNVHQALSILESLSAHAMFFITTSLIDTDQEFWWDSLERVFFESPILPAKLVLSAYNTSLDYLIKSSKDRMRAYSSLHHLLKYSQPSTRNEIVKHILQWASIPLQGRSTHRVMNSAEVQKMAKSQVASIGAHTYSHAPLKILTTDQQREDILQSKITLERLTGNSINYFSYPFGLKKDYDTRSIALCKELGFKMACSNYYDHVHSWTDPYQIPRMIVRNWPLDIFKEKINQFLCA